MSWKQFIIDLLKVGYPYFKLVVPAFLFGLHIPAPNYAKVFGEKK